MHTGTHPGDEEAASAQVGCGCAMCVSGALGDWHPGGADAGGEALIRADAASVGTAFGRTGDSFVDGLSWAGSRWSIGGDRTLAWQFATGFSFTNANKAAIRSAFDKWESVANIDFVEVASGGNLRAFNFADVSTLHGVGFYPISSVLAGSFAFNANSPAASTMFDGGLGIKTLVHEIGHALGLKHPSDTGGSFPSFSSLGIEHLNRDHHTIMASNGDYDVGYTAGHPATPMPLDIYAIQAIYGANTSTGAGNDVYALSANGQLRTIWDAGGSDTISAQGLTGGVRIDLQAGAYSNVAASDLTAIAYNVTIEGAIGGSGDDTITGNGAANSMFGGFGRDTMQGLSGADALYGNRDADTIDGGDGDDSVFGGQEADTVRGDAGGDRAYGNLGDDAVSGGDGDDSVYGGQGNDTIWGGDGDDLVAGNAGNDTLSGGLGADLFVVRGSDVIADFSGSSGDRISMPGTATSLTDGAGGALVAFADGSSVTLLGVASAGLSATWFV